MSEKFIYSFAPGKAEGNAEMKEILGGKGANLAEMTGLGIPVPPGFTITTEVCDLFNSNKKRYPDSLQQELKEHLQRLEQTAGKKLGDAEDPLLVSVRSGAAVSMPGMMDTILNLGLNDRSVVGLAAKTANPRFAWDSYRRFIQMFSNVAMGMDIDVFEDILREEKTENGILEDYKLTAEMLQKVVSRYKEAYKNELKSDFPQQPIAQLQAAIDAVFNSWNNEKAVKYRRINNIRGLKGTAVNVMSMVFGNYGDDSGTGVCFSRDPSTGEKLFYGEYLMNAQGEDVVAGIRTPAKIEELAEMKAEIYRELLGYKEKLENHYRDMQDIEFTIQQDKLFILQTRNGKRTGAAALRIAMEMEAEKIISRDEAIKRVAAEQLDQLFHPMIDPAGRKKLKAVAKGLNASPGAACGRVVFRADTAEQWAGRGEKVMLVRKETSPEDIGGMHVSQGILTSTGGMTSHAAVVARGMGTPCIVGCKELVISDNILKIGGLVINEGDWLSIDGASGEVFNCQVNLVQPQMTEKLKTFLEWCDEIRTQADRGSALGKGFAIRANADQPVDAKQARAFGAEGIGLCRTEHMFFEDEKLKIFQTMIVAKDLAARNKALEELLPLQQKDFEGIFSEMNGLPVTVRLLDPPLHEFLPQKEEDIKGMADRIGITEEAIREKIATLHESNPMLGHRGCRLAITYPEIYDMQFKAIMQAACVVQKAGKVVLPEIMIPLIGTEVELVMLRERGERIVKQVLKTEGISIDYKIGTMIEVPRAVLVADKVAEYADFFSFGTNDLTQMTLGFSRDDVGSFVPEYIEQEILPDDPFASIDQQGVGEMVKTGVERGRRTKKDLKIGVCGEHGGDPASIDFFYHAGLNYVSCSPYRLPIARLAAAQTVLNAAKK